MTDHARAAGSFYPVRTERADWGEVYRDLPEED
jgi:hypothetical protein